MRIFLLIVLLSSCSAEWHYKKACKKDTSYCSGTVHIDTFTITDTFNYYQLDTTNSIDTITIDTGSVRVQIIREFDVIRTTIKQKPDTTYLTITKTVPPKIIYKRSYWWLLFIPFLLWLILKK